MSPATLLTSYLASPSATVAIVPSGPTSRIPRRPSAMNRCPLGSTQIPYGPASEAPVAGPPSPQVGSLALQAFPVPTTVFICPGDPLAAAFARRVEAEQDFGG